ncbi:hypothetical protein J3A83DRAFT_1726331 [Scleroderma citrinum]
MSQAFPVEISGTETVAALREAIKSKMPVFHAIAAFDLALYNISLPWDGNLREKLEGLMLDHVQLLKNPFQTLSEIDFPRNYLHIVVDAPLSDLLPSVGSLEKHGIRSQRNNFLANNQLVVPSSTENAKYFSTRQQEEQRTIYCNRPHDAQATIPPTLLHAAFGQFLDDCEMHEITADVNSLALGLHIKMSGFYPDEEARAKAICAEFSKWGLHFVISKTRDGYATQGDIFTKGYRFVIAEFMNEVCDTRADPYNQASLYYLDFTGHYAAKMHGSSLPCMVLLVFGPYIAFAGAAWNRRPVVQTLSSTLPMHYHPTDTVMRINVARHLGAFKKAVATLKEYYQNLPSGPVVVPRQSQLFPHCTSFRSLRNNLVQRFKYINQPFEDNLIFFAALSNQQLVCIKFARQYSKDAHEICASRGHAPALHGFEKIPRG